MGRYLLVDKGVGPVRFFSLSVQHRDTRETSSHVVYQVINLGVVI